MRSKIFTTLLLSLCFLTQIICKSPLEDYWWEAPIIEYIETENISTNDVSSVYNELRSNNDVLSSRLLFKLNNQAPSLDGGFNTSSAAMVFFWRDANSYLNRPELSLQITGYSIYQQSISFGGCKFCESSNQFSMGGHPIQGIFSNSQSNAAYPIEGTFTQLLGTIKQEDGTMDYVISHKLDSLTNEKIQYNWDIINFFEVYNSPEDFVVHANNAAEILQANAPTPFNDVGNIRTTWYYVEHWSSGCYSCSSNSPIYASFLQNECVIDNDSSSSASSLFVLYSFLLFSLLL